MDKPIVEIIKAKKGVYSFYSISVFLIIDRLNLLRVNFNSFYTNNKPKVLYTFNSKFIFLNINL